MNLTWGFATVSRANHDTRGDQMALNPEEVVNKRFSATKFRQGYDEEEVDEFLDEVVSELRRLNGENEELRGKLSACESRVAEFSRPGSRPEPVAPAPPPPAPVPVPAAAPVAAPAPVAASASTGGVDGAAGMLALAQRLHDEHVEAGKTKGAQLVSDAQEQATRMVREAEDKQRQTLGNLESQRQVLERKVEDLRSFEREYRSRLKAYLENQLRDLESTSSTSNARPSESESTQLPSRGGQQGSSTQGGSPTEPTTQEQTPRFPFGG